MGKKIRQEREREKHESEGNGEKRGLMEKRDSLNRRRKVIKKTRF